MEVKKRVLIVDDTPESLMVMARMLQHFFEIRLARSADAALEVLKGIRVDLILLDIEMPGMSGFDLLKEIQLKDIKNRKAPVIFITAHASADFIGQAIQFKPKDYLVKPVSAETLYKKIDAIIGMPKKQEPRPANNPQPDEGTETKTEPEENK